MSTNDAPAARDSRSALPAWTGLWIVIACFALTRIRADPPPLVPADAPEAHFSGARALAWLERIEGEGRPHPVGSPEAARVRELLVTELERLGLAVEVQTRLATSAHGTVAVVRNVIATLPGRESGPRVLVCAHYDSVPAGPGSSDDGAGTAAILEIARALKAGGETPRNGIVLLIDEGEEAGLIGARAFVDAHPLAKEIGVVINLEARGTGGRAHMFETSEHNAWLIRHYARAVEHPDAVSVAFELYRRMPNDTDLSVFKNAGMAGMNLAFIDGVSRYHTSLDDVAHLDPRSLQHLGETALALVRAFADADLSQTPAGNAVYADVLGLWFVHWPETWCTLLAALALVVSILASRGVRARSTAFGILAAIAALIGSALAAHAIAALLVWLRGVGAPWTAHPWPARVAVLCGALAAGLLAAQFVLRFCARAYEARVGAHLVIAVAALCAALIAPSACYIVLLPALAAALGAACHALLERARGDGERRAGTLALILPLTVGALFVLQLLVGIEEAFGLRLGAALGAPLGIVALLLAPAWFGARAGGVWLLAAVAVIAFVAALVVPAHDADSPASLNIGRVTDAREESAHWVANPYEAPLPPALADVAGFAPPERALIPWWPKLRTSHVASAQPSREPPPRLDVVRERETENGRVVVARLRSPRGAVRFVVHVPERARLRAIAWRDQRIEKGFAPKGLIFFTGIDAQGVELEIEIEGPAPVDVHLIDATPLGRDAARALMDARPSDRAPRGEGDVEMIHDRVRL